MEEEYRTSSNFHQYINIIKSIIPSSPPTIQFRYESSIHKFDGYMANFFIGIAQELVVDRLISNVRARRTRSGSATYIDQRHHGIIADLLA